nr:hypothetical protein Hi04_10k_c4773_00003 [uncultured bacterium]
MADYQEQQRRENQRRWEENQRQERQRQEEQRFEQQRREQERRDRERRANEDRAARKLAAEIEAERRRSNQRVLDQQKHQAEMTARHDKDNEARRQKALRRDELATQDPNWFGPKTENSIQIHRNEPVFPEDFQPLASERSPQIDLRDNDPFAAIDDLFLNLLKRFWVTILVVGAVAGLIYGWYSLNFSVSWEYIEWIGAYSLVGGLITLFAVALMRPVAKVLLVLAAIATVGGLAWIFYKIFSFF